MMKDHLPKAGALVELMLGPGDIRSTSVGGIEENIITLNQTKPVLTENFINQAILLTFLPETRPARVGYKARIISTHWDDDGPGRSAIKLELSDFVQEYDLRKYPRFDPRLFDRLQIAYGDDVLGLKDISSGGARCTCRDNSLERLTKGERINLCASIGGRGYSIRAEVMRIKHPTLKGDLCEIAVAFLHWDRNFLHP